MIQFELQLIAVSQDCFLENWSEMPSLKSFFFKFSDFLQKNKHSIVHIEYILKNLTECREIVHKDSFIVKKIFKFVKKKRKKCINK